MADTETVEAIVASADEARQALFDLELALEKEIEELRYKAFQENRSLNDEEKARRTQIRASQAEIKDAHVELAYVTLSRLDNSEDVAQLQQKMDQINRGLEDDLAELKKIESVAKKVDKVAEKVAEIAGKVAEKVANMVV